MFKHKVSGTYYSLYDLSGWNGWSPNDGKLTLSNKLYIDDDVVELAAPLEDWRSTTLSGYQIYSSSEKKYNPLKVLQSESIPSPNSCFFTLTGSSVTIYPNYNNTQLIVDYGGDYTKALDAIMSKEDTSKAIIPSWIIFELQAGGGGGGGTNSGNSRNGSGGGGGGYISGLLKLNFSVYPKYEIQIGSGGTGGVGSNSNTSGSDGGGSYIYGVNSSGAKTLLVAAYGGKGGFSNNDKWDGKTPAAGGSAEVRDSNYVKNATIIMGGKGGQTNAIGTCSGENVASQKILYISSDFPQHYGNSYFYKNTTAQSGGSAGSSSHSGGGGASALGPGGAGGGTRSDGNAPTSGFGGGGGGGRWTVGTPKNGGNGKNGCCKLYY